MRRPSPLPPPQRSNDAVDVRAARAEAARGDHSPGDEGLDDLDDATPPAQDAAEWNAVSGG